MTRIVMNGIPRISFESESQGGRVSDDDSKRLDVISQVQKMQEAMERGEIIPESWRQWFAARAQRTRERLTRFT